MKHGLLLALVVLPLGVAVVSGVPVEDPRSAGDVAVEVPSPLVEFASELLRALVDFLSRVLGADASTRAESEVPAHDEPPTTDPTATERSATLSYEAVVTDVDDCGRACRDVTVAVTNEGDEAATDVVVETHVYAGNSTDPGDLLWHDEVDLGRIAGGETVSTTQRVDLPLSEAYAIEEAGGWITVEYVVQTDDGTVTILRRRQVS